MISDLSEAMRLRIQNEYENLVELGGRVHLGYKAPEGVELSYAHEGDSGIDIRADRDTVLPPWTLTMVHTGVYFEIPEGYEIQVRSKSGLALNRQLFILNSPGTVDSSYTGEVVGLVFNAKGEEDCFKKGEKIAQCVLMEVPRVKLERIEKIEKETSRGADGFGSTGR